MRVKTVKTGARRGGKRRPDDWMLVRLEAVTPKELENMLRLAWSRKAPRRLLSAASG